MSNGSNNPLTLSTDWPDSLKAPTKVPRGQGAEAKKVNQRLAGFNINSSPAVQVIQILFSSGVSQNELKSIATLISLRIGVELDRQVDRSKKVLYKWFDENWELISPIIGDYRLLDKDGQVINLQRELAYKK